MTKTIIILPRILLTKAEHQARELASQQHQRKSASKRPLEVIIWSISVPGGTNECVLITPDRYLCSLLLNHPS